MEHAITIAIAIGSGALTVVLFLIARPAKRIVYSWSTSSLIARNSKGIAIAVSVPGVKDGVYQRTKDPHLLQIKVRSVGRADILEEDFVEPMRIDTGATLIGRIGSNNVKDLEQDLFFVEEAGSLIMRPGLIKRGDWVTLSALYDGRPEVKRFRALANVSVISEDELLKNSLRGKISRWLDKPIDPWTCCALPIWGIILGIIFLSLT